MNIYSAYWVQDGGFGLNAAVVAKSKEVAIEMLGLDEDEKATLQISVIGRSVQGAAQQVIAKESL